MASSGFISKHRTLALALVCLAFLALVPDLAATTRYVDGPRGSDFTGCGALTTPCATIQQAVNQSVSTDTILVATGAYTYSANADPCPADHTAVVCILNKSLTVRGGYDGIDWSSWDPVANLTVINGGFTRRGVLVSGGTALAGLVMEGFTVRNGLGGPRTTENDAFGGGLSAVLANLSLRDMVFENNAVRGRNTSSGAGGAGAGGAVAIRSASGSPRPTAALQRVTFTGNQAIGGSGPVRGGYGEGGGLWINYSDVTGSELSFSANRALGGDSSGSGVSGGTADSLGGAVAFKEASVSTLSKLTVTGNSGVGGDANAGSGTAGGAFGGGLYGERATFSVIDAAVYANDVTGGAAGTGGPGFGGGVMALDSDVSLERVAVFHNSATGGAGPVKKGSGGGGGCYFSDTAGVTGGRVVSATNSIIADNAAVLGSGGGTTSGGGGGVFLNGSQLGMTHCTVAHNSLSVSPPMQGIGIVVITRSPTSNPVPSRLDFDYGIISDHLPSPGDAAVHVKDLSSADFLRGMFAANGTDTAGAGTITGLGTMASVADLGYVSPGSPGFDYHLRASSPAIGAAIGSATLIDIDGEPRDTQRDIGADEFGAYLFADGFESGSTGAWTAAVP